MARIHSNDRDFKPPIHCKMSMGAFERLPRRVGWKYEYYGGKAHVSLSKLCVTFRIELASRPIAHRPEIRRLVARDRPQLRQAFMEAFASAADYANYSPQRFEQAGNEYLDRFFGKVNGTRSPASVVAELEGEIIGAAMIKLRPSGPLLDCLFVCTKHIRGGRATALVGRAERRLLLSGQTILDSYVKPANLPSMAWHESYGFRELPDLWLAEHRWRIYSDELDRLTEFGGATEEELVRCSDLAKYWGGEAARLRNIERENFWAMHPR